jgi:hypothetical protein
MQLQAGSELCLSVGPVGVAAETSLNIGGGGACSSFSTGHGKGCFVGLSFQVSLISTRPEVNAAFYGQEVDPSELLSGRFPRPALGEPLYRALSSIFDKYRIPPASESLDSIGLFGGPRDTSVSATARTLSFEEESSEDEANFCSNEGAHACCEKKGSKRDPGEDPGDAMEPPTATAVGVVAVAMGGAKLKSSRLRDTPVPTPISESTGENAAFEPSKI